jgi:hypothetical protein
VSRYCGNADKCDVCGITYRQLNTGMSYRDIWALFVDNHEDTSLWRYKRRHTILGKWHQIKKELWRYHTEVACPNSRDYEREQCGDTFGGGVESDAVHASGGDTPF